jgi:L-fucose isomerase-like protein
MPLTVIPFFSDIASPDLVDSHTKKLRESGARILSTEEYRNERAKGENLPNERLVFYIGCGGSEKHFADLVSEINVKPPLVLFSHQSNNSLPAAMEIRTYLEQNGYYATIIHLPIRELIGKLSTWVEFERHLSTLRSSTLGVVGAPSFWLIASNVDRKAVAERWGLGFKDFNLDLLKEPLKDELQVLDQYLKSAKKVEIPAVDLSKAAMMASRLDNLMESEELTAVTVQCFDFLQNTSVSGCLALSHINNKPGRVAGCEGDIPSTFTMLLARLLTGSPSFMANVTEVDAEENTAVFAHCTVATSLVKEYDFTTHFETNLSVGIRGYFEKQKVTIFKVSGSELLDYWVSSGTVVENLVVDDGCRTQIRVELENDISYFLENSLANHHIVIPGDHVESIEDFFSYIFLRG